jgi:hypothetical protein
MLRQSSPKIVLFNSKIFLMKTTEKNSYEECKIPRRPNHGDLPPGQDWFSKFGTTDASMMSEINAITEQNRRLKRIYAETSMQNARL